MPDRVVAKPSRRRLLAAFFAIYFFWGTTFFAVRFVVPVVPPPVTVAIRCLGGALVLWMWLIYRGEARWPTTEQWKRAVLVGCVLFPFSQALLATGLKTVSSGLAALMSATIPLWLVVLQSIRRRALPRAMVVVGLVLGTAGVAMLVGGAATLNSGTPLARVLLLMAAFNWSLGSLLGRGGARPESVAQATAMQLTTGGIVVLVASLVRGDLASVHAAAITPPIIAAFAFLVICGTVLGFGAYTWLLQVTSPALVGSYAFVNPVVALGLGAMVGDDHITVRVIVAAVLVIGAVVLTTMATQEPSGDPHLSS